MEFMNLICPKNPNDDNDRNSLLDSECFQNMVLGFGANLVTVVMIVVLGFTGRNVNRSSRNTRMRCSEVLLFSFLLTVGACLSLYDVALLLNKSFQRQMTVPDEWFFRCSQFAVWAVIMLFWRCRCWFSIFGHQVLCFWWIAKPLFDIPHLLTVFSSLEVMTCLKESSSTLVVIIFAVFVNTVRITRASYGSRKVDMLEDPLLSFDIDSEEQNIGGPTGIARRVWYQLTFKSINSVMDIGILKQLDFDDLVQPPVELNEASCYRTLRRSWLAVENESCSNPSLFRAICYAYGWQYIRLGLLKVVNDCMAFAAPLLLNRLIWFLQRGSGHFDGYILAVSLGLTSILKYLF